MTKKNVLTQGILKVGVLFSFDLFFPHRVSTTKIIFIYVELA